MGFYIKTIQVLQKCFTVANAVTSSYLRVDYRFIITEFTLIVPWKHKCHSSILLVGYTPEVRSIDSATFVVYTRR